MIGRIEQIYREHRQGLYTLALSIAGRPEAAEDAVHDAVVRLVRSGVAPTGDPTAYVFAAVRNAALDRRRGRGGRDVPGGGGKAAVSIFDVADPVDGGPSAADVAAGGERDRLVADAVAGLPEDQREAVVLHLYAGLSFAQAAESVGVPLQTLASRYRRGLAVLRERLESLR